MALHPCCQNPEKMCNGCDGDCLDTKPAPQQPAPAPEEQKEEK